MKGYHSFVFLFMLCSFAVVFATVVFFVLRFSFSSPTNAAAGFNIHIVGKWFQLQRPFHILMTCAELKVGETRSDLFNTTSSLFIYHQHTPLHRLKEAAKLISGRFVFCSQILLDGKKFQVKKDLLLSKKNYDKTTRNSRHLLICNKTA